MSVPILDASAWREYRGKPANSGINAITHMAKVADTTGKLRDCFVKLLPTDTPALLCEAIGWLLAGSWLGKVTCHIRRSAFGVRRSAFGAIILVPVEELRKCSPLPPEFNGMTLCPAWCSEVVSGKTVKQIDPNHQGTLNEYRPLTTISLV